MIITTHTSKLTLETLVTAHPYNRGCIFSQILEYFEGGTLSRFINSKYNLGEGRWPAFLKMARDLCRAVEALHNHKIIHGDLKVQNLCGIDHCSLVFTNLN